MTELVILRGLPGCGKSTRAKAWVAEDREHRARVNRDDLRVMLDDGVYVKGVTEGRVLAARDAVITGLLKRGVNVISDDTNLPRRTVRDLVKLARQVKADVTLIDMTDVTLDVCLKQNEERTDKTPVPDRVIRDYYGRYVRGQSWPMPVPEEDDDERDEIRPYVPDPSLPDAIIVDIDGTVALKGTRNPFDETRVHEDRPNIPVIDIIQRLWVHALISKDDGLADHYLKIIFLSGRTDGCRQATEEWLDLYVGMSIDYDLHMRKQGDMRKDWIVKQELFDAHVRGKYNVIGVFDDRQQVVDFWRKMGLQVYQVAPGDF